MRRILSAIIEGMFRMYSRVALTERGGFRMARMVRRFRPREQWRGTFVTPDSFSIDLDLHTYPDVCMAYGIYELDTARLIKRLLKPGDHFVDGGANIGYFTMLAAGRVGSGGQVDSFEPQADNRRRLEENLLRNDLAGRVRVHPVALSSEAGEVHFYSPMPEIDNHGTASIFPDPAWKGDRNVGTQTVPTIRMDEALRGAAPTLIKLDVEGAELLAVEGMSGLLKGDRSPAIIIEFNPTKSAAAGYRPEQPIQRLLEIQPKYQLFSIGWRLRPMTLQALAHLQQGNLLLRAQA